MMTQSINGSRKRVRGNREEEGTELPLSKRIHNLRINNGNCCNLDSLGQPELSQSNADSGLENGDQWISQEAGSSGMNNGDSQRSNFIQNEVAHERINVQQYLASNVEAANNPASWVANNALPRYSPDLDASANPFYYNNNKLLYDLYVERMQRCGMI